MRYRIRAYVVSVAHLTIRVTYPLFGRIVLYGPGPHVSSPVDPVPWTRKTIPPGRFRKPLGKVITLSSSSQDKV